MANKLSIDIEARIASVLDSFDQIKSKSDSTLSVMKTGFAALAGAFTLDKVVDGVSQVVKDLASLDDAAEKAGVTVEDLSGTFNKFRVSGGTLDELTGATSKLAKAMIGADEESGKAAEAFSALGIQTRDSNGNLRSTVTVLNEVAGELNKYEDGANKVALAQALFGKSGADLLPKLRDLATETSNFRVITSEQAAAAEALEKSLNRLRIESDLTKQQFLSEMIPTIERIVTQFNQAREAGLTFLEALKTIGAVPGGGLTKEQQIEQARKELEELEKQAESMNRFQASGGVFGALFGDPDRFTTQIAQKRKELEALRKQAADLAARDPNSPKADDYVATAAKLAAPKISGGKTKDGADKDPTKALEALAKQRTQIFLDEQKRTADQSKAILDAAYSDGVETISSYFEKRSDIAENAYRAERLALDDLVASQSSAVGKTAKGTKEWAEATKELETTLGKRNALDRDFQQTRDISTIERIKATRDYGDATAALIADLQTKAGNSAPAALLAFDKQMRVLRAQAEKDGDTATISAIEDKRRQIGLEALYADALTRRAEIEANLAIQTARNESLRVSGAITDLESQKRLTDIRQKAVVDLEQIAEAQGKVVSGISDPRIKQEYAQFIARTKDLAATADVLREKFGSIGENSMSRLVDDFASGSKSIQEIAKDLVKNLIIEFAKIQIAGVGRKIGTSIFDWISGANSGGGGLTSSAGTGLEAAEAIFGSQKSIFDAPVQSGRSSKSLVINQTLNMPNGFSRAEGVALMNRAKIEAQAEIQKRMSDTGRW